MSGLEWAVLVGGMAAIGMVNWWFFLWREPAAHAQARAGGVAEVHVKVAGGYSPATIRVARGQPVRLVFDRQETSSCSEEIVFPDFGIRRFLPAFERTTIELQPEESGTYEFTCGMSMLHGRLVVE